MGTSCVALAFTALLWLSWQADRAALRDFAYRITQGAEMTGKQVEAIVDAVYREQGFAKNKHYFLWPALEATPLQILRFGGDCADKSRLLVALLEELGVSASPVMLSLAEQGPFVHTVVEARATNGSLVADPVYNIVFPRPDANGYFDLRQLRDDPSILPKRIEELVRLRGTRDKIYHYKTNPDGAHYGFPKTINLDKSALTRIAKKILGWFVSEPELIYRPRFLEDPKRFFVLSSGALALLCLLGYGLLREPKAFKRAAAGSH